MVDPRQLDEQLSLIEAAGRDFDAGNREAAIRIANGLKAIFHQTGSTSSLLSRLRATFIRLASSVRKPPHPQDWFSPLIEVQVRINVSEELFVNVGASPVEIVEPGIFVPWLDRTSVTRLVQAPDWWRSEPIFILNHSRVTRRDVVLWAADKEEGETPAAADRPSRPIPLLQPIGTKVEATLAPGRKIAVDLKEAHFGALRQMAHEIARSPELKSAVRREAS